MEIDLWIHPSHRQNTQLSNQTGCIYTSSSPNPTVHHSNDSPPSSSPSLYHFRSAVQHVAEHPQKLPFTSHTLSSLSPLHAACKLPCSDPFSTNSSHRFFQWSSLVAYFASISALSATNFIRSSHSFAPSSIRFTARLYEPTSQKLSLWRTLFIRSLSLGDPVDIVHVCKSIGIRITAIQTFPEQREGRQRAVPGIVYYACVTYIRLPVCIDVFPRHLSTWRDPAHVKWVFGMLFVSLTRSVMISLRGFGRHVDSEEESHSYLWAIV